MFYCTDTSFVRWFVSSFEREKEGKWNTHIKCKNPRHFQWNAFVALPQHTLVYCSGNVCILYMYMKIYTLCDNNNSNILQFLHLNQHTHIFSPVAISWLLTRKLFECNKSHVTQFKFENFRFCWIVPADNHLFCCICFQQLTKKIFSFTYLTECLVKRKCLFKT